MDALQREQEQLELVGSSHGRRGEGRWREKVNLKRSPEVITIHEKGAIGASTVQSVWVSEMHVDASMIENRYLAEGERVSIVRRACHGPEVKGEVAMSGELLS